MLNLTRKPGEAIRIGDDIIIHFKEVHGDKVRVGVEAPADVVIMREEVYERIKAGEKQRRK